MHMKRVVINLLTRMFWCRYAVLAYLGYNQDLQRGVLLLLQQVQRAAPGIST